VNTLSICLVFSQFSMNALSHSLMSHLNRLFRSLPVLVSPPAPAPPTDLLLTSSLPILLSPSAQDEDRIEWVSRSFGKASLGLDVPTVVPLPPELPRVNNISDLSCIARISASTSILVLGSPAAASPPCSCACTYVPVFSGNRKWATAIVCINDEGRSVPPFLGVQGANHLAIGILKVAYHMTGLSNQQAMDGLTMRRVWLKHFDKHTAHTAKGPYRMLVLDGHESHDSAAFQAYCQSNNIIPLVFLRS
jgi:hypothetical protein